MEQNREHALEAETICNSASWPQQSRSKELGPFEATRCKPCSDFEEITSRDGRMFSARRTPLGLLREGECEIPPSLSPRKLIPYQLRSAPDESHRGATELTMAAPGTRSRCSRVFTDVRNIFGSSCLTF